MDEQIPDYIAKISNDSLYNAGMRDHAKSAGCFHCLRKFEPSEIENYCNDYQTCLCPKCGIDSVILTDEADGIPKNLLSVMRSYYFRGEGERCSIDSDGKRQSANVT